jgi:transposase
MAGRLLPDALWNEIEGLFPVCDPSPLGGRPPTEARVVLTAMLFVLKTGIAWEDLPTEAFDCSYKTCLRRISEWSSIGLWQQIHEVFLAKLRGADLLDWSRVLVDSSLVKAPLGGENAGQTRRIAAARAVNTACSPTRAVFLWSSNCRRPISMT